MSSFSVTVEQVEILDHTGANNLQLARVGGYRAVVPKNRYQTGDWVLYIPEQAVLDEDLIKELELVGRLAGAEKNRVKPVRLRGEVSQGIVCLPRRLLEMCPADELYNLAGQDLAEKFGIVKWEPPIPTQLAGDVDFNARLVKWPDIENIKRYPHIFSPNEDVIVTEKIHGTCCLITLDLLDGKLLVSSKGLGSKHLNLRESDTNSYWRAVRQFGLEEKLLSVAEEFTNPTRVAVFGEVYGAGIQDLGYGTSRGQSPSFAAFDLWVEDDETAGFIDAELSFVILELLHIPVVPIIYEGEYDEEFMWRLASGAESVSGQEVHLREGVVVRPFCESISEVTGSRKIVKFISDDYLLRKGNTTEYE